MTTLFVLLLSVASANATHPVWKTLYAEAAVSLIQDDVITLSNVRAGLIGAIADGTTTLVGPPNTLVDWSDGFVVQRVAVLGGIIGGQMLVGGTKLTVIEDERSGVCFILTNESNLTVVPREVCHPAKK